MGNDESEQKLMLSVVLHCTQLGIKHRFSENRQKLGHDYRIDALFCDDYEWRQRNLGISVACCTSD